MGNLFLKRPFQILYLDVELNLPIESGFILDYCPQLPDFLDKQVARGQPYGAVVGRPNAPGSRKLSCFQSQYAVNET